MASTPSLPFELLEGCNLSNMSVFCICFIVIIFKKGIMHCSVRDHVTCAVRPLLEKNLLCTSKPRRTIEDLFVYSYSFGSLKRAKCAFVEEVSRCLGKKCANCGGD